ncbi:glycosyltransferase family 2 protein [Allofrancisella guangzhouensis]|uniref:Teichuronic acid biosynthesis glycosyl transferase tuaG n=1 Tax=Allofrancisella guangzhouensis TaxID=594679 RepID=A0A0A8E6V6_9GAMM|nr:glycosyltransferase family 2 protein [Allofrancisella guangzhouensis]AJC49332.1 teichuronic acid biosynthesis glycosyl transferase tuaG [Allofrancisella guangzhouensis]MBK2043941.1 glycosyltransferase family 2 protein [Allofrancisella guangzhouensis]MBK2044946.1 glycosyltransferase family 2 protein [Allofrancisella guangzhouensis]
MSNNHNSLVSIVVPTYNAEQFIVETIFSVINQTYVDWEIIVVDDCSTDNTKKLVKELINQDSRICLIELDKNFGGPAGPRNHGVKKSRGEYIAFLDSDDIWHPQKLEIQMSIICNDAINFVCSQMQDFKAFGELKFNEYCKGTNYTMITSFKLQMRDLIPTSSVLIKKSLLLKEPFEQNIEYKAVEDYHCWMRVINHTKFCAKVDNKLLFYRRSDGQISSSKLYMTRKVYMIHRKLGRSKLISFLFTSTHVLGGIMRYIKKEM